MKKDEFITKYGEEAWKRRLEQGRVHIRYANALELIQDIQEKKDDLGMEMADWIKFGDEVVGMLCDMFDIEEPEVEKKTKEVTTIIHISCDGEGKRRTVHGNWWNELSLEEIADTTAKIVEEIVGSGKLEEGTI